MPTTISFWSSKLAARTVIIGKDALHKALAKTSQNIHDGKLITKMLDEDMNKFAHIITGFMKSTIYHKHNVAGADAFYAGYEADRGGRHDYAQRAINAFNVDKYLGRIVKDF